MASMYSLLHIVRRSLQRAWFPALLVSAFILLVISIASDQILQTVGLFLPVARAWGTVVSVSLFVLALAEIRLGYPGKAATYREAARTGPSRSSKNTGRSFRASTPNPRLTRLSEEYQYTCSALPAIPGKAVPQP